MKIDWFFITSKSPLLKSGFFLLIGSISFILEASETQSESKEPAEIIEPIEKSQQNSLYQTEVELAKKVVEEFPSETRIETEQDLNGRSANKLNKVPAVKSEKETKKEGAVYRSALGFALWVDKFFGEEQEIENASYDFLRLVNTIGWREGEGVEYRPRIRAKVNLPKISKKFSLLFADGNDATSGEKQDIQNQDVFNNNKDHSTSAAFNYASEIYDRSRFDTRVGIDSSFDSFVILKHSFQIYKKQNLSIKNLNYMFWKEEDRFGINPRLELDYVLKQDKLFRWKYSILRSEKSFGNEWSNTFSLIKRYSDEDWLSYDIGISGYSEYDYDVNVYRAAIRYRRQLDIKWLYFEIEPELLWQRLPEDNQRKLVPGLLLRLEVQFEK